MYKTLNGFALTKGWQKLSTLTDCHGSVVDSEPGGHG